MCKYCRHIHICRGAQKNRFVVFRPNRKMFLFVFVYIYIVNVLYCVYIYSFASSVIPLLFYLWHCWLRQMVASQCVPHSENRRTQQIILVLEVSHASLTFCFDRLSTRPQKRRCIQRRIVAVKFEIQWCQLLRVAFVTARWASFRYL